MRLEDFIEKGDGVFNQPFNIGDRTVATDGLMLLSVPKIEGYKEFKFSDEVVQKMGIPFDPSLPVSSLETVIGLADFAQFQGFSDHQLFSELVRCHGLDIWKRQADIIADAPDLQVGIINIQLLEGGHYIKAVPNEQAPRLLIFKSGEAYGFISPVYIDIKCPVMFHYNIPATVMGV